MLPHRVRHSAQSNCDRFCPPLWDKTAGFSPNTALFISSYTGGGKPAVLCFCVYVVIPSVSGGNYEH